MPPVPVPLVPAPLFDPLTLIRTDWLAGMLTELSVAVSLEAVLPVEAVFVLVGLVVVSDGVFVESPVEDEDEVDDEDDEENDGEDVEDVEDDEDDEDEDDVTTGIMIGAVAGVVDGVDGVVTTVVVGVMIVVVGTTTAVSSAPLIVTVNKAVSVSVPLETV